VLRLASVAFRIWSAACGADPIRPSSYMLTIVEAPNADADLDGMFERWQHLNPEAGNIRLALEWAFESDDVDLAVRLAASSWM
jgi:hypothetical protein